MKIVSTIEEVRAQVKEWKKEGLSIGFVPTMGYLHEGHMSLIDAAGENDRVVVSIFVNPMQFGPTEDLASYPRDLKHDAKLCEEHGVDLIFHPTPEEMYGDQFYSYVDMDVLTKELCGLSRPVHFRGVCTVVTKLFNIVTPDRAYFGEKDFQQLAIIREMVRQLKYNLEIVGCSIVREEDGLALSSRNKRLSAEERESALNISRTLFKSRNFAATHTVSETQKMVEDAIEAAPGLHMEYFEIVDGNTLQKISNWEDTSYVVGCITVFCGEVRLIDNIKYKE